jgi:hypothetical protein
MDNPQPDRHLRTVRRRTTAVLASLQQYASTLLPQPCLSQLWAGADWNEWGG